MTSFNDVTFSELNGKVSSCGVSSKLPRKRITATTGLDASEAFVASVLVATLLSFAASSARNVSTEPGNYCDTHDDQRPQQNEPMFHGSSLRGLS